MWLTGIYVALEPGAWVQVPDNTVHTQKSGVYKEAYRMYPIYWEAETTDQPFQALLLYLGTDTQIIGSGIL